MRRILLALSLLTVVAAPIAAHAASMDLITITGNSTTYQFVVPASPVIDQSLLDGSGSYFALTNVPVTISGVTTIDPLVYFFTAGTYFGGLEDDSIGTSGLILGDALDPQLFSGPITAPTFNLGATGTLHTHGDPGAPAGPVYSYSITSASVTSTPEPSSVMLLGTGAAGLVSLYRRRRVQA